MGENEKRQRVGARRLSAVTLAVSFTIGCGTGGGVTGSSSWPRRVTLSTTFGGPNGTVRLVDGVHAVPDADMALHHGPATLSFEATMVEHDDVFCPQGTFATLADVPTDPNTCPASASNSWEAKFFLIATPSHTSGELSVLGLSVLVRNAARNALYRLRVLGETFDPTDDGFLGDATATFEYEPVPSPAQ